jgi:hypothetical protein
LCKEFGKAGMSYKKDDGGVYTDSAEFVDLISECTNISVGYYKEHSTNEHQDIKHLIKLADACLKVDWESLPTKRNKKIHEPKYSKYSTTKVTSAYDKLDNYEDYDIYGTPANSRGWSRNGSSKKYDGNKKTKYDDYVFQEDDDFYFKTPGLKSESNIYLDNGADELLALSPYDAHINNKQYNWIISKFANTCLTQAELSVIREQYLDIENNEYDKFFYDELCEMIA